MSLVCAVAAAFAVASLLSGGSLRPAYAADVSIAGNPWAAYQTSVDPGGRLQLVSASTGLALQWEPTNGLDGNLSTPEGLILAWPSPSVLVTHDGARHWTRTLSAPGGFWGVDALDRLHAWAVGVTGLYRTVDGGARWQRAGEPDEALVRVAFVSPLDGVGLTLSGKLVESRDGGRSWQTGRWSGQGEGLCSAGRRRILLAGQDGAIWRSTNAGGSWREVAPRLARVPGFSPWWSDLSCRGRNAIESSQAYCYATLPVCGSEVISRVRQTTKQVGGWREVVTQSAFDRVRTRPASALDVPLAEVAAVGAGGLCLAGYPFGPPASAAVSCTHGPTNGYRKSTIPKLPLPSGSSTVVMQGLEFLNAKIGWLLVDEYTAAGSPSKSTARAEVWTTSDGGRVWNDSYESPRFHPIG
jgi:hypothetical protein